METAAISYRVADFLKQHPPFHAMEEEDLLNLARQGRVKFFEADDYIMWQGASRFQVFVIQQGAVSLWDEQGTSVKLHDVRGPGDLLGIDQFDDARTYPFSARSSSEVLIYAPESQSQSSSIPGRQQSPLMPLLATACLRWVTRTPMRWPLPLMAQGTVEYMGS